MQQQAGLRPHGELRIGPAQLLFVGDDRSGHYFFRNLNEVFDDFSIAALESVT